jgi:hypothetical protein
VPLLRAALPRAVFAAAVLALFVETWPAPLPVTRIPVPGWVPVLAAAPDGAAIDLVSDQGRALYYQTLHGKPLAVGYIARYPRSTLLRGVEIVGRARRVAAGDEPAAGLVQDGFRHLVAPGPPRPGLAVRWAGDGTVLYELAAGVPDAEVR